MLFLLLRWVRIPSRDFRVIFLFFENVGPKFLILFFLTTLNILIKPQMGFKSAIQIYIYLLFSGLITQI